MLKALIKKQFFECFRSYFVNPKTNKKRSKGSIIGMFVFFAALMLFLCVIFFGMAFMMGGMLQVPQFAWLYYAIMSMVSIALGAFGSVFNTYSTLYMAKDNEMLLAMPIPASKILMSRMSLVYGLSILYSGTVWLPAIVFAWIFGNPTVLSVIFGIFLIPLIGLFVTVITCVLGWVVALISARVKNRSFLVVILSLVFFGGYYFVCFNLSDFFTSIMTNMEVVGGSVKTWANFLYQLGSAANGSISSMLIFSGVTLVLFAICCSVLSKSFHKIVTKTPTVGKTAVKAKPVAAQNVKTALFRRELKRFTSSPTYMLNCGLGIIILPILMVLAVVKRGELLGLLETVRTEIPSLAVWIPLAIAFLVSSIVSMNVISTPSISLEGKNLWLIRSMPVSGKDVLEAKLNLHVSLNIWPGFLAAIVIAFCADMEVGIIVLIAAFVWMFTWLTGAIGLTIGLLRPNFQWTTEAMPIKQSLNVIFAMLAGWAILLLLGAGYYFLQDMVDVTAYLGASVVLLTAASVLVTRWLKNGGAKRFERL